MKRRRFLTISGASLLMAGIPAAPQAQTWQWRGTVLGAEGVIKLVHQDGDRARTIIRSVVKEIRRLERIFSLYDPGSAVSILNRAGRLNDPPPELVSLLSVAHEMSLMTDGAFDVTVQPLWQLYAGHFSSAKADPEGPDRAEIESTLAHVGYKHIDVSSDCIALTRPGMALTFNGIAQGCITDRIVGRLRDLGMTDTLVNTGEIRALGKRADGRPWQVGIDGSPVTEALTDQAIATSSIDGTRFDSSGRFHHLLDPRTGYPSRSGIRQISVVADEATIADAASTAFSIMQMESIAPVSRKLRVRHIVT